MLRNPIPNPPSTLPQIVIDGKTQKLLISDLQMEDAGLYTLKAGDLESACQVTVNGKNIFETCYMLENIAFDDA